MNIKFIHTADVHIGSIFKKFTKNNANLRRREIKDTFFNILNYGKEKNVDFIFISGDLFEEESVTLNEINEINNELGKCQPIQVCMIAGNHDPIINDNSFYKMIPWNKNIHILDNKNDYKIFHDKKTIVYGCSWDKKLINTDMTDRVKIINNNYNNILLAHGDIYGASNYMPINKHKLMQKGFDYVALGHIHKYDKVENNIVYSGSPEALNFNEDNQHGFVYGILNNNEILTEFIPSGCRNYKTIKVSVDGVNFENELINRVICNINNKDIFKIVLTGTYDSLNSINLDYISDYLSNHSFHLELVDNTDIDFDIESILKEHNDDIIGDFIRELLKQNLDYDTYKKVLSFGLKALFKEKGITI